MGARGSGQLFGPIPHLLSRRTASAQDHSSRTSCRHSITRAHVLPARRDTPVQIGLSTGATIQTGNVGWTRYGALNGGNGEDGIAAVLGGVALIDLFGSLRRRNLLPTRPGPRNPRASPALPTLPPLAHVPLPSSSHLSMPPLRMHQLSVAAAATSLSRVFLRPSASHPSSVSQQWSPDSPSPQTRT